MYGMILFLVLCFIIGGAQCDAREAETITERPKSDLTNRQSAASNGSVLGFDRTESGKNWNFAPIYDMNGGNLSVQKYWGDFDISIPEGRQFNFYRFEGTFRGGRKAKLIDAELNVFNSDDSYALIALFNNYGSGAAKPLYSAVEIKSTSKNAVGVGMVANIGIENGATPRAAWNIQLSKHGVGGSGVANNKDIFQYFGSNNSLLGINNGIYEADFGLFFDQTIGFSGSVIRAHNHTKGLNNEIVFHEGSFMEWWGPRYKKFQVDREGSVFIFDANGQEAVTISSFDGSLRFGGNSPSQQRQKSALTGHRQIILKRAIEGNGLEVSDSNEELIFALKSTMQMDSGQTAVRMRAGSAIGSGIFDVSVGSENSCGSGYRCLRIQN